MKVLWYELGSVSIDTLGGSPGKFRIASLRVTAYNIRRNNLYIVKAETARSDYRLESIDTVNVASELSPRLKSATSELRSKKLCLASNCKDGSLEGIQRWMT